ncbi:lipoxygenase [Aetokthonos hydrillicola Thurmond2011]|jgi:arachidonate 15-lipoxygenase|uniref:Lipoxygenase n=1 Tax=Aetokthonos hydrillicola Thurmond2011 TaxID=2712845 RepID=A0AAP5I604_9CYAN|nr:lipoxygenase family protein [Aetokthonos hydrillicola]MBO3457480.1 lipoxygenase [Aetokthonos hydrillicola CCALA 1050]MBW4585998.1 lipoxygenase [Aetokthonos hydrillicola CCALA 1050]MDR9893773.1 lipoxygenase [Aetokthonos hydrillicola Thurmond2011]
MKPYLPQQEPNPTARENILKKNREDYQFDHKALAPIPVIDRVPKQECFSAEYTAKRLASMANLPANMLAAKAKNFLDPLDNLEEYEELLNLLPKPNLIPHYRTDSFFAEQRLSGANAIATHRIDDLPEDLAINNSHFQQVLGADYNLDTALKQGKIYFLDYPLLQNVKGGNSESGRKYLPKTRALFYWQPSNSPQGGSLVSVAIELKSESGNNKLVYTPKDAPLDWFFAKLCLQVAEGNHQELGSHFSFTHAVMAPFAIVTARQLGENHPIALLLKPHFRFMLFDNDLGRKQFLQAGGPVDRFMAGTLEESLTFVAQTYQTWSIQDFVFPTEIKKRKMDDPEVLPHYPFRDDGLLVWQAVENFVINYVKLYYKTPQDLAEDYELQNWAQELAAKDGGCVKGMPQKIETLEQLIEVLTVVIFTCGPLHSVLNFTQYEYMAFVPNMPYAAYHPVPETKGIDMATIMKFLPPFKQAADQVFWTMVLTSYHYDKLGFYDEEFADPLAQELLIQFRQNLADVERQIDIKNQTRQVPYQYFKPSQIINSINT